MEDCIKIGRQHGYNERKEYTSFQKGGAYLKNSSIVVRQDKFSPYFKDRAIGKRNKRSTGYVKSNVIVFKIEKSFNTQLPITSEKNILFKELASTWVKEAAGHSSMSQALTPTYLKILTLGKEITPLILKELERKPNFWFLALRTLNDDNPVPKEHMGNVIKMREAWLSWGRKNNLI